MMAVLEFLGQSGFHRLSLTLLHFLWQGLAIVGCVALLQGFLPRRRPELRYAVVLIAFGMTACCPLVTFFCVEPQQPMSMLAIEMSESVDAASPNLFQAAGSAVGVEGRVFDSELSVWKESSFDVWGALANETAAKAGPVVVLVWLAGVLLLSTRLLVGLVAVRRLKRSAQPLTAGFSETVNRLIGRLKFRRVPRVFASLKVNQPLALGLWRPMVLLPASWLTSSPPSVLEAIVAHELAHIRRWDLWVNVFQRVVETLLFYHPAVWWLSKRVRSERELCTDQLAVSATGARVLYAEALEYLARRQVHQHQPLLAAGIGGKKMAILNRVRSVLGVEAGSRSIGWWSAGLIGLAVPAAVWLALAVMMVPAAAYQDAEIAAGVSFDDGFAVLQDDDRDRERDRDRGDRDGARREGRRDGDRDRPESRRDGDRNDAERRDGDRPRRQGDRRDDDGPRREGDRDRPVRRGPQADRPGDTFGGRRVGPRDGGPNRELLELVKKLRQEVEQLRNEVRELRETQRRGPGRFGPRPDVRPNTPRTGPARPPIRRGFSRFGVGRERERGDRERSERPRGRAERDGADREREQPRRERDVERERGEDSESDAAANRRESEKKSFRRELLKDFEKAKQRKRDERERPSDSDESREDKRTERKPVEDNDE